MLVDLVVVCWLLRFVILFACTSLWVSSMDLSQTSIALPEKKSDTYTYTCTYTYRNSGVAVVVVGAVVLVVVATSDSRYPEFQGCFGTLCFRGVSP